MTIKKKTYRKAILWSIIVLFAAVLGYRVLSSQKKTNYTEIKVTTGSLETYYSFSGSVEAEKRQTIFADNAMQISEILVEEGERVSKGTLLMKTSMGQKIKSDIDGEVSIIHAAENAQLMPGSKLIDIVDYSDLQLKVQVDEYDLFAVSKGKEANVTIHAIHKDLLGKITDVSKEGQYLNGVTTFTAIISLPKEDALRVGMSAEAKILNKSVANVLILPMSAIQFDENNSPFILVKNSNDSPRSVELTLGINDGVHVEIVKGVTADDTVLVPPTVNFPNFGQGPGMRQDIENTPREGLGGG